MDRRPRIIAKFDGEYSFLSNFYPCIIDIDGIRYGTVEHAFQASKTDNQQDKRRIAFASTPGRAKRLGQSVTLRPDWEDIKVEVMRGLLIIKFVDNPVLGSRLIATGNAELVEGNTWGDQFWGVCGGEGKNWLGRLLMEIREESRLR